jgi:hypothetical protein
MRNDPVGHLRVRPEGFVTMRTSFIVYLLVIVGGLAYFVTIAARHV